MNVPNIPECLILARASLSSLVQCLQIKPEPSRVKNLSGAPFLGRLLALPVNIRLGWKGLLGTNTLAYCEHVYTADVKSVITIITFVTLDPVEATMK
jgi:hypothetical protein